MRFSERMGHRPVRVVVQADDMDDVLRTDLWNVLKLVVLDRAQPHQGFVGSTDPVFRLLHQIWLNLWQFPVDSLSTWWEGTYRDLRKWWFEAEWHEVYDLVEFAAQRWQGPGDLPAVFNTVLERNLSAYRLVDRQLVPVTSPTEIEAVEDALRTGSRADPAVVHLGRALDLLGDRKQPDYRNSIKESISAVEAACQRITGQPKTTLGKALKTMEANRPLHPALRNAFDSLYGWTSDGEGIRHALADNEAGVTQADAMFMLVTCSAFVNYLRSSTAAH